MLALLRRRRGIDPLLQHLLLVRPQLLDDPGPVLRVRGGTQLLPQSRLLRVLRSPAVQTVDAPQQVLVGRPRLGVQDSVQLLGQPLLLLQGLAVHVLVALLTRLKLLFRRPGVRRLLNQLLAPRVAGGQQPLAQRVQPLLLLGWDRARARLVGRLLQVTLLLQRPQLGAGPVRLLGRPRRQLLRDGPAA